MSRIAYVNGRYVPFARASVAVEDRGFQFADGVYEVCAVRDGALIDEAPHLARLERSLGELKMRAPVGMRQLGHILRETVRLNRVRDGLVYVQVSRGVARRDHAFPTGAVKPTLVVTARSLDIARYAALAEKGIAVVTLLDARWGRCDIKSTGLLANVLAKQAAREAGAFEAWLVDRDGLVTEGASTTAWIVDAKGVLRTRALSNSILPGVTRGEILPFLRQLGVELQERAFSVEELKDAREAFISAATFGVLPVTTIDGKAVGEGKPGLITAKIGKAYWSSR
jgi:D-alanine transaminase